MLYCYALPKKAKEFSLRILFFCFDSIFFLSFVKTLFLIFFLQFNNKNIHWQTRFSFGCRPYALIENVVSAISHRGQGYGKAVVLHAIDAAWQAGCYKAMLLTGRTDPAIHKFYEACGFVQNKTGFQVRRS